MFRVCILILLSFAIAAPALASVEVALPGDPPVVIEEIYHRDDKVYIPLEDLLTAIGLEGSWDAVEHVYRIRSYRGTAIISPGSRFLRIGEQFTPITDKPRFIDNRLRVTENFVLKHLSTLVPQTLYYRNLDPAAKQAGGDDSLDRLFSFMVKKKRPATARGLQAIAIDPGHGGHDAGVIGPDGLKEKDVNLAVALNLQKVVKMQLGIPVHLSRDADYGLTLEEHLKPAANEDVDALLLLHAQSAGDEMASGIYLYIRKNEDGQESSASLNLANALAVALREEGLQVNAVIEAPLLHLGRGDLPTVLVEMGYLSHPDERLLLTEQEGQKRLALALFNGLKSFGQQNRKGSLQ